MRIMKSPNLERGEVESFAQHIDTDDHATGPLPQSSDRLVTIARWQRIVDHLWSELGSEP